MRKFNSTALKEVSARQLGLKLSAMGYMAKHTSFGNRYYVFNLSAEKKMCHCNTLLYRWLL
ncbi:DUF3874 domain-containing protein [Bacteroides thetaiotaomicron]|nr:DUF3874 domain-containing protein [Bacteroides thetaiotaomicron]